MRHRVLAATAFGFLASASASAQTFSFGTPDNPNDPTFDQLLGNNDHGTSVGYFGAGTAAHPISATRSRPAAPRSPPTTSPAPGRPRPPASTMPA